MSTPITIGLFLMAPLEQCHHQVTLTNSRPSGFFLILIQTPIAQCYIPCYLRKPVTRAFLPCTIYHITDNSKNILKNRVVIQKTRNVSLSKSSGLTSSLNPTSKVFLDTRAIPAILPDSSMYLIFCRMTQLPRLPLLFS